MTSTSSVSSGKISTTLINAFQWGVQPLVKFLSYFSTSMQWIAETKLGATAMVHILDDFLFIAPSYEKCKQDLERFLEICQFLGVPIANDKTMGPSRVLPFAGIDLDTTEMVARLPADKLEKCNNIISEFMSRSKVTLKQMQSLIGLLNFTCSVVLPGRPFLRRLIDLTIGIRKPHHLIRLTRAAKSDLHTWSSFLSNFNGKSFILDRRWFTSHSVKLYTDSAASLGFGAVFGTHWFFGAWPGHMHSLNITLLEFYPIVAAVGVWSHALSDRCVYFFTDNQALVHIINNQTSRDPAIMHLVRYFVLSCLNFNILFRAKHIPGCKNVLADSLSRLQVSTFRKLAPVMDLHPTAIPPHLLPDPLMLQQDS